MLMMDFRPPLFFLTGLAWLILSFLLGLGLFFGMVLSTPLPSFFRLMHVHGALVGGVAQIILGAMLAFIPPLLKTGGDRSPSHPILFVLINGGTVGMLVGFGMRNGTLVAIAGFLVVGAFLAALGQGFSQARSSLDSPPLNLWFYGVAVLLLLIGLGVGEAMALGQIPLLWIGQARLTHIHLNLLGFVTLTIIGTMHNFLPTILNSRLHSPNLARLTFFLMPAGILMLIVGFLLSNIGAQIAAGGLIGVGVFLYTYNLVRTWIIAGKPRNIASDHLMVATMFLVLAVMTGILVSTNYLWNPPKIPFGTLHLMAYTHLALIGFILQTILGALSHLLPISLALGRVPSSTKRGPYLAELTKIVNKWGAVQVTSLTLGTLGLSVVAALVWSFPLSDPWVERATWVSLGLLFTSLLLFSIKVGLLLGKQPSD